MNRKKRRQIRRIIERETDFAVTAISAVDVDVTPLTRVAACMPRLMVFELIQRYTGQLVTVRLDRAASPVCSAEPRSRDSFEDALSVLSRVMDRKYPGWRADPVAVAKVGKAARLASWW